MSSSAFFIDAAANTVMVLSCATAGTAAAARTSKAAKIPARRYIDGAPCRRARAVAHASQASVILGLRQAEAPFRQSLSTYSRSGCRDREATIAISAGREKSLQRCGLLLGVRHVQHAPAGRRQLRHGHRRFRLRRLFGRLRMQRRILEPEGEVAGRTAFAHVGIGLALAFARARRAFDADVEVIVMA